MPCARIGHAIVCSRGRRKVLACGVQIQVGATHVNRGRPASKRCDGRGLYWHGTHDLPICASHAHHVKDEDVDYCPDCSARAGR
jgi:hypothetical protein